MEGTEKAVLLGVEYKWSIIDENHYFSNFKELQKDFYSRLWFTYRSDFELISTTSFSSDSGWGCMLRSGQMLLGEALIRHYLSREWRVNFNDKKTHHKYVEILSMFNDRKSSPFSIQNIAIEGVKYGKKIGEWFGPATICSVLRSLTLKSDLDLNVYVPQDGVIYRSQVVEFCTGDSNISILDTEDDNNLWRSVLILLPLRLGLDSFNVLYETQLKKCLSFPQSVGIAGGRPNASLFFVGYQDRDLFYLDPHYTRPAVDIMNFTSYTEADFESFHCSEIRKIPISRIDPSLVVGFFCKGKKDVKDFLERSQQLAKEKLPIFSVESNPPSNDDLEIENFDSESDQSHNSSEDDF